MGSPFLPLLAYYIYMFDITFGIFIGKIDGLKVIISKHI